MRQSLLILLAACASAASDKNADPVADPDLPADTDLDTVDDSSPPDDTSAPVDTAPVVEPVACPPPDVELCGNDLDDNLDGATDCAIEGWSVPAWARLEVEDASVLLTPGDVDGDGHEDLVAFKAVDLPQRRVAASVLRGPFPAGQGRLAASAQVVANVHNGTTPMLAQLDADAVPELVMPVITEPGWVCDSNLPWQVYTHDLPTTGIVDASAAARSVLSHPLAPFVAPAVYTHPTGDVDGDDLDDFFVSTTNCQDWTWFLVSGADAAADGNVGVVAISSVYQGGQAVPSRSFDVGDVDGDGHDDLAIAALGGGRAALSFWSSLPSGALDPTTAPIVLRLPDGLFTDAFGGHDLTLDGVNDLVITASGAAGGVFIVPLPLSTGTADLTSVAWAQWPVPDGPAKAVVAELTGDAWLNLAIGVFEDGVHVQPNPCEGVHALSADGFETTYGNSLVALDADGDGHDDLAVTIEMGDTLGVQIVRGGPAE